MHIVIVIHKSYFQNSLVVSVLGSNTPVIITTTNTAITKNG